MVGSQIYLLLPCLDACNILYVCFLPVISIFLKQPDRKRRQMWGSVGNNCILAIQQSWTILGESYRCKQIITVVPSASWQWAIGGSKIHFASTEDGHCLAYILLNRVWHPLFFLAAGYKISEFQHLSNDHTVSHVQRMGKFETFY